MSKEQVIERIRKCLELAGNNPSAEEAATAALMAQKLMAKHDLELTDIGTEDEKKEDIVRIKSEAIKSCKWKYSLGRAIAGNFKCKMYIMGTEHIVFFGTSTDAQIAKDVFTSLFKMGHKLGLKARRDHKKLYGHGDNIYNSFVLGFVEGVKSVLDKQCRALAIVIQPEVVEAYEDFTKDMRTKKTSFKNPIHGGVHASGRRTGEDAMRGNQSNQIEG